MEETPTPMEGLTVDITFAECQDCHWHSAGYASLALAERAQYTHSHTYGHAVLLFTRETTPSLDAQFLAHIRAQASGTVTGEGPIADGESYV